MPVTERAHSGIGPKGIGTLLAAALLILPVPVQGQGTAPPSVDERIRVETTSGLRLDGHLTAMSASALEIRPRKGPLVRVPIDEVERLTVARGQRHSRGRGAGRGFLFGAGAGLVLGAFAGSSSNDDYICSGGCAEEMAVVGALGLGVVGLLLGTVVGSTTDRWLDVPLDQLGLEFDQRRGVAFGLSFAVHVGASGGSP